METGSGSEWNAQRDLVRIQLRLMQVISELLILTGPQRPLSYFNADAINSQISRGRRSLATGQSFRMVANKLRKLIIAHQFRRRDDQIEWSGAKEMECLLD